ncbi:hypothetical protein FRC04_002593 [Tulasnella sp. 424]|nr:hypothetical protein FRC04_002593 [Tulasnella sp. 424]KAG8976806.1 hypothetical protein FRC05_003156 [Tulasnella sp. 425]
MSKPPTAPPGIEKNRLKREVAALTETSPVPQPQALAYGMVAASPRAVEIYRSVEPSDGTLQLQEDSESSQTKTRRPNGKLVGLRASDYGAGHVFHGN